jgi:PadR family transcriptional regulator, regulatory protein PadR
MVWAVLAVQAPPTASCLTTRIDGLVTSEGTVYPLLARLRRDGLVTTAWHESPTGPPRRYYELTAAGHQGLELFTGEWDRFTSAVDRLLKGGPP